MSPSYRQQADEALTNAHAGQSALAELGESYDLEGHREKARLEDGRDFDLRVAQVAATMALADAMVLVHSVLRARLP